MKQLLHIFILFIIIISCDPCDDCDSVTFEPTISLVFINQDSIKSIDDSLAVFAFNDSALNANIDSLELLRDSLEIINDSIANGGSLESQKTNLENWISGRLTDSTFYATLNEDADSLSSVFSTAKSTINSGLLQLDRIEIPGAGYEFIPEDSAAEWGIPLSYDAEFNRYEITIRGVSDMLEFTYDTYQEVDAQRNVLIRAENIQLVSFTENKIDSVLTNCEEICNDDNATFTVYF